MGWYVTITEEMRATGLTGSDLLVYALIHSYSQNGNGCYYGGLPFLSKVSGLSQRSMYRILDNLMRKGFIEKSVMISEDGTKVNCFKASFDKMAKIDNMSKSDTDDIDKMAKIDTDVTKNEDSLNNINNIYISRDINKKEEKEKDIEREKEACHRFQKPTVDEVRAYCEEKNLDVDPEIFWNFYESKGWVVGKSPMKNWHAALATWKRGSASSKPAVHRQESVYQHNLRVMQELHSTFHPEDFTTDEQ